MNTGVSPTSHGQHWQCCKVLKVHPASPSPTRHASLCSSDSEPSSSAKAKQAASTALVRCSFSAVSYASSFASRSFSQTAPPARSTAPRTRRAGRSCPSRSGRTCRGWRTRAAARSPTACSHAPLRPVCRGRRTCQQQNTTHQSRTWRQAWRQTRLTCCPTPRGSRR